MPLPASLMRASTPMFLALIASITSATVLNVPPVGLTTIDGRLAVRVGDLETTPSRYALAAVERGELNRGSRVVQIAEVDAEPRRAVDLLVGWPPTSRADAGTSSASRPPSCGSRLP